jgi:hypothetical protein
MEAHQGREPRMGRRDWRGYRLPLLFRLGACAMIPDPLFFQHIVSANAEIAMALDMIDGDDLNYEDNHARLVDISKRIEGVMADLMAVEVRRLRDGLTEARSLYEKVCDHEGFSSPDLTKLFADLLS